VQPDQEESGARIEALEKVENLRRVNWGRSIINGEPHFRVFGFERSHHRSPPLAIGYERRVKKKHVGDEDRRERQHEIDAAQVKAEERRQESEAEKRAPRPARIILHCSKPGRERKPDSPRRPATKTDRRRASTSRA